MDQNRIAGQRGEAVPHTLTTRCAAVHDGMARECCAANVIRMDDDDNGANRGMRLERGQGVVYHTATCEGLPLLRDLPARA